MGSWSESDSSSDSDFDANDLSLNKLKSENKEFFQMKIDNLDNDEESKLTSDTNQADECASHYLDLFRPHGDLTTAYDHSFWHGIEHLSWHVERPYTAWTSSNQTRLALSETNWGKKSLVLAIDSFIATSLSKDTQLYPHKVKVSDKSSTSFNMYVSIQTNFGDFVNSLRDSYEIILNTRAEGFYAQHI